VLQWVLFPIKEAAHQWKPKNHVFMDEQCQREYDNDNGWNMLDNCQG